MPLEALYTLMKEQKVDPDQKSILDGSNFGRDAADNFKLVTQEFFQSRPNGIDPSTITDDVLAFCTLVMSYAKYARPLQADSSPKVTTVFMPRTEFNTLYRQVSTRLPGDLFTIFNALACYTTSNGQDVVVDTKYCSGSASNPQINGAFEQLQYSQDNRGVIIRDWIQAMQKGDPSPDLLTTFDQGNDGSIGGLGTALEGVYGSNRQAPLFEFRDLMSVQTSGIEQFMNNVDQEIQRLHGQFPNPP